MVDFVSLHLLCIDFISPLSTIPTMLKLFIKIELSRINLYVYDLLFLKGVLEKFFVAGGFAITKADSVTVS